jgi:hypothetical protein
MKSIAILLSALAASCTAAVAQTDMDTRIASVHVDCAAFNKNPNGDWVVTKPTKVQTGTGPMAGSLALPPGMPISKNAFEPNGADLAEVLNRRCK